MTGKTYHFNPETGTTTVKSTADGRIIDTLPGKAATPPTTAVDIPDLPDTAETQEPEDNSVTESWETFKRHKTEQRAATAAALLRTFTPEQIYSIDIETDTTNGDASLDPSRARITDIAVAVDKSVDPNGGRVFDDADEHEMLTKMAAYVDSLPSGVLVTWNGAAFDLPFIHDRMRKYGDLSEPGDPGLTLEPDPEATMKYPPLPGHKSAYNAIWHKSDQSTPHKHLDIAESYKLVAEDNEVSWSLKPTCKYLGINMIEVDRNKLHELTNQERNAYVLSDSNGTRILALKHAGYL